MTAAVMDIVSLFSPISLEEMDSVKLMNRIDTKFVIPSWQLPAILQQALAEYRVQDIDGVRIATYDTLYYDTLSLDMYMRHHDRQLVRQKIRIRQYVESDLTFLEIKRKNNKGRTRKKRIIVPDFHPEGVVECTGKEYQTVADFVAAKSIYSWSELTPALRTVFHRITLVNSAKTERLTIDADLLWENQRSSGRFIFPDLVIIELKRDGNMLSPMLRIMRQAHIHPFKVSKYCLGTALTTPLLKQNRFKRKVRMIQKILNNNNQ